MAWRERPGENVATSDNEQLEFLGDAILGMVVCRYLYDHYQDYLEGELTKIKSAVVSRKTCAEISEQLGLPQYMFLGNGIAARNKLPLSLSAAVYESLIAAIALDGKILIHGTDHRTVRLGHDGV